MHVIDTLVVIELEEALSEFQRNIREGLLSDARKAWSEFATMVTGAQSIPFDVTINNRTARITRAAQEHKADMLVLGAFGERPVDVGLGTMATACVRNASSDVLLVRDTHTGPFKTVVVGLDFSETSALALKRAAELALLDKAELRVFHVFDPPWHRLHYRAPTVEVAPHFDQAVQRWVVAPAYGICPLRCVHVPGVGPSVRALRQRLASERDRSVRAASGRRFDRAGHARPIERARPLPWQHGRVGSQEHDVLVAGGQAEQGCDRVRAAKRMAQFDREPAGHSLSLVVDHNQCHKHQPDHEQCVRLDQLPPALDVIELPYNRSRHEHDDPQGGRNVRGRNAREQRPVGGQIDRQQHGHVERVAAENVRDRQVEGSKAHSGNRSDQLRERRAERDQRRADERLSQPGQLGDPSGGPGDKGRRNQDRKSPFADRRR